MMISVTCCRMKAKYVLLNHFSQRYPKLPRVQPVPVSEQDDATRSNPKVALAFDLMTLPLKSFDKVAGYTDAMEVLFKEEEKEDVDIDGSGENEGGGKQQKNGKTPKGKNDKNANGNGSTELSNSQRRKMERKQQWETKKTPGGASSPVAGEKRQSGPKDDVDMERGTVKRTKSENVVRPKSENVVLPSESTS
jgi:ribonuclease Z